VQNAHVRKKAIPKGIFGNELRADARFAAFGDRDRADFASVAAADAMARAFLKIARHISNAERGGFSSPDVPSLAARLRTD